MCCHCASQNFTGMKKCCCHAAREHYQVIPVNYRTCQWRMGIKKGEHLCSPFHYINCLIKLLLIQTPEQMKRYVQ